MATSTPHETSRLRGLQHAERVCTHQREIVAAIGELLRVTRAPGAVPAASAGDGGEEPRP